MGAWADFEHSWVPYSGFRSKHGCRVVFLKFVCIHLRDFLWDYNMGNANEALSSLVCFLFDSEDKMKNIILANFETFPVFDGFIEILRLDIIFCETISL